VAALIGGWLADAADVLEASAALVVLRKSAVSGIHGPDRAPYSGQDMASGNVGVSFNLDIASIYILALNTNY
jgi:hypothetical protein